MQNVPIEQILEHVRYAPSGDNLQPWRFVWQSEKRTLRLYGAHPANIPEDPPYHLTGTFLGVGIVTEYVLIASRYFGYNPTLTYNDLFRKTPDDQLVATFHFDEGDHVPDQQTKTYFEVFKNRFTCRVPYSTTGLSETEKQQLSQSVTSQYDVHFMEGEASAQALAEALHHPDTFFWNHHVLRSIFTQVVRSDASIRERRVGLPISTLGVGLMRFVLPTLFKCTSFLPFLWKQFQKKAYATNAMTLRNTRSFMFLFSKECGQQRVYEKDWDRMAYVRAGREVARVWLCATSLNVQVQPLHAFVAMASNEGNQVLGPLFAEESTPVLRFLRERFVPFDTRALVFVFRIGKVPGITSFPVPRKEVASFLSYD